jgi:DNA polymerase delta subunit 3
MVWESYSEDEPQPKKQKTPALPSTAKGKKGAKAGGRDIMSFFKAPPKK